MLYWSSGKCNAQYVVKTRVGFFQNKKTIRNRACRGWKKRVTYALGCVFFGVCLLWHDGYCAGCVMRADGGRRDNQTAQGAACRRLCGAYAVRIGPAVEDMSQSMSWHQVNQNSSLLGKEEEDELQLSPTAVGESRDKMTQTEADESNDIWNSNLPLGHYVWTE